MKSGFWDKIVERLDKLDPKSLQAQFLRLWQERGLLEAVFNVLHDGIIVLDVKGAIEYANRAAASMLGVRPDEIVQQPVARYFRDIAWERILDFGAQGQSGLIRRELELSYPEKRFLNMYIVPVSLNGSEPRGAVVILRDMSADREKEQKILKSERLNALTYLAAGVAHEIGNPLNSLHIHLQLLERELENLPGPERKSVEKLVGVARGEVERLNMIITQFLKAIRPAVPDRQLCRLEELVGETVEFMKHEIRNRDVILEVKVPEPLPAISVDRNQIKQAIFNIIKNALQAMNNGGILAITLFANDRFLGVSFKDNGEGMSGEQVGRLFKPYQSGRENGSGLGLFIVQRIVQDHGGEIEVTSRPKAGTNFTIYLPLDARRVRLLKAPRRRRAARTV